MSNKLDNTDSHDAIDVDEDSELTQEQIKSLNQALVEERARVRARLERHLAEASEDFGNLPDEMDIAARISERSYIARVADKEKKLLREIDRALAKFSRGTFGICEGSGEPIGFNRLKSRPWTRYSLEHKEMMEREEGKDR